MSETKIFQMLLLGAAVLYHDLSVFILPVAFFFSVIFIQRLKDCLVSSQYQSGQHTEGFAQVLNDLTHLCCTEFIYQILLLRDH